ncbi:MAG: hypothetical protein IPN83_12825 [Holophagales bacterium]|nr:hypothetical protein [Holophagales bacterium]
MVDGTPSLTVAAAAALRRAAVVLKSRVDAAPANGDLVLALAEALYRLALATEAPEEKARLLARVRALDPYDPRPCLALARLRQEAGDLPAALGELRAAAVLAPGDPEPWRCLGLLFLSLYRTSAKPKLKLADRALEAFGKALQADPRDEATHLCRLAAAAEARVASPEKSRLPKVVETSLAALRPRPERVPLVASLALSAAWALHFPKHAFSRNPQEKLTEAERAARARGLSGLAAALRPWLEAFPGNASLAAANAAVELLAADDAALAERAGEALAPLEACGLFHLFLHSRLEEAEPGRRLEHASLLGSRLPLVAGLARELLAARGLAAREAVVEGRLADATRLWKEGLELDPHNRALHHDLALAALASRDAAALETYLGNTVGLLLFSFGLDPAEKAPLLALAARHEGFAHRLRGSVQAGLAHAATLDAGLVQAWLGEARAALLVRAFVLGPASRGASPGPAGTLELDDLQASFVAYAGSLPAVARGGVPIPKALRPLLDPAPSAPPPLHYEALGATPAATREEIETRASAARDEARRQQVEALARGEKPAAARAAERLARIEAASAVLSDEAHREAYRKACLPEDEHAFHLARRQLVVDLHELAQKLHEAGRHELAAEVIGVYFDTPHDQLEPYFQALQSDASRAIRSNLTALRFKPLVDAAQEEMKAERWAEAAELLRTVVASGGDGLRPVLLLLAASEMKAEMAFIEKNGRLSSYGVWTRTDARERVKRLGPAAPPAGAFDAASLLSALKAMQELEARKGRPGEGAK